MIGKSISDIVSIMEKNNLQLEFSSGIDYSNDMIDICINAKIPRLVHNYFPAPVSPFVLNLASKDDHIRNLSIEHCKKCIKISSQIGAKFYAAHCGFCIDPKPEELGHEIKLSNVNKINREEHLTIFYRSIREILNFSDLYDIDFYIENNVIATFNMIDGLNPLLGCEASELVAIAKNVDNSRFGILLDTAHLKVSANTLGLSLVKEVDTLSPYVKALHHSDNNGFIDSNDSIDEFYWFLPFVHKFSNLIHVLEVKKLDINQIKHQINLICKS